MTPPTVCLCNRIPTESADVIGFCRDVDDSILGVMWNCGFAGTHTIPIREATQSQIIRAIQRDEEIMRAVGAV